MYKEELEPQWPGPDKVSEFVCVCMCVDVVVSAGWFDQTSHAITVESMVDPRFLYNHALYCPSS